MTQLFSTEFSDWGIQSKNLTFSTGSVSRKTPSKKSYTCSLYPSHRSFHHKTQTHTHAHPYQVPHSSIIQQRLWLSLLFLFAASRRGALLAPLASSVSHDSSSARYRCHFANNGYTCCSFGGFRLSPTPPTRLDEGSSRVKHALLAKNARSTEMPTGFRRIQQYSLTPTASRKSTKTIKSTRLTIRRRARRTQSKKSPVEKGRFRLAESDCERNGLTLEQTTPGHGNACSSDNKLLVCIIV